MDTDSNGSLTKRFDAWGRPRDPPAAVSESRPEACPDSYGMQAPHNAQNYNRYSYVLNNPLMYTDPSGYRWISNREKYGEGYNIIDFTDALSKYYVNMIGGYGPSTFGNPSAIPGSDWTRDFGKMTYEQAQNLRFWSKVNNILSYYGHSYQITHVNAFGKTNFVGSFGDLGTRFIHNNGALSFGNPTAGLHLSAAMVMSSAARSGGDEFNWGIPIGAAGTAISAGVEYAENMVRKAFKTGRNPVSWSKLTPSQQAWRTANVLGKNAKYVKYAKGAGVIGTGISVGMAGYDIASGQGTTIDYLDVGVGTTAIGAVIFLASNPGGWVIGAGAAVYFAGRLVYDIYEEVND